ASEDDVQVLAVQAARSAAMAGGMQHFKRHTGHLELPALSLVVFRICARMEIPPRLPVKGMQSYRRLIPSGYLDGRARMPFVTVGADHGKDFPIAPGFQCRSRVVPRVDHDHLVVVPDDPGI